jgi:hypothetical protein
MSIKDCYNSKFWKEVVVEVVSAWRPCLGEQMVTISDSSGEYVIVNKARDEEGFIGVDDEGQVQHWKLRCKDGKLEGHSLKPAIVGKTKQYRDYYGKGQGNGKCT